MITTKLTKENFAKVIGSRCSMKINSKKFLGYSRIIDTKEYAIFERPAKADAIVAAYGDIVVKRRGDSLFYIPNVRIPFISYRIDLNAKNFPGLFQGSHFMQCLLLPYLRVVKKDTYVKDVRLCIFTDKGQVFHNKPARDRFCDGFSKPNDIIKFEESVVWDLPGKKHPTNRIDKDECECYFPGLPEYCYKYFPCVNTEADYCDIYGNGGFGKSIEVLVDGKKRICTRLVSYIIMALLLSIWANREFKKNITTVDFVYDNKLILVISVITVTVSLLAIMLYDYTIARYVVVTVIFVITALYGIHYLKENKDIKKNKK